MVVLSNAHDFAVDGAEVSTVRPTTDEAKWVSKVDQEFFDSSVKPFFKFIFNLPITETL